MNQSQPESDLDVLGKFWTAANILSLIRILLAIPLFVFILQRGPGDVLVLTLTAVIILSDWLDGKVARWTRTVSEWGKVLDPIADKVAGVLVILALTVRGDTVFTWWFLAFLLVRDALIVAGATVISRQRRRVSMSSWSGKIAVAVLSLTVLAELLLADPPIPTYLFWASVALLVYSYLRYLQRYLSFRRERKGDVAASGGNTDEMKGTTAI